MATGDVEGVEEDLGAGEISGGEEGGAVWTTEGATGVAEGGSKQKSCCAAHRGRHSHHLQRKSNNNSITSY